MKQCIATIVFCPSNKWALAFRPAKATSHDLRCSPNYLSFKEEFYIDYAINESVIYKNIEYNIN